MNLLDISTKKWASELLEATTKGTNFTSARLADLLGAPCSANDVLGSIAPYFQHKYGFSKECQIVAFSGDNICALAAMGLHAAGDVGMSLGSSDTV